jgi:hypothetical protein
MALYMIVERFPAENLDAIYERLHTKGRGLPDGLHFVECRGHRLADHGNG